MTYDRLLRMQQPPCLLKFSQIISIYVQMKQFCFLVEARILTGSEPFL